MQLGAVDAGADDRAVCGALGAQLLERVLDERRDLILVLWRRRLHDGAMSFGADLGGAFEERDLRGTLARAQLVEELVRVLDDEPWMTRRHRPHELLTPR